MVSTSLPPDGSIPLPADVPAEISLSEEGELLGPVGWHRDPWQRHQARFFDGQLWTEHVADGGIASVDSTPVARLARSRPRPARRSPSTELGGPRVVSDHLASSDDDDPDTALRDPVLLLAESADSHGTRRLSRSDDTPAGVVILERPALPTRLARRFVVSPTPSVTRVTVRNRTGDVVLRLRRPARRIERTVDVVGRSGLIGRVTAEHVRQGVHGRVFTNNGSELGHLDQREGPAAPLRVTDAAGAVIARLTPVWDIPGSRHHLPPGTLLLDRRHLDQPRVSGSIFPSNPARVMGPTVDTFDAATVGWLLLGAVLAPALLVPPRVSSP